MNANPKIRLKKLAEAHELVKQAILGAQWEERYALQRVKREIEAEIKSITQAESHLV